jgi:membrane protease YdiL (CAAX protease family)
MWPLIRHLRPQIKSLFRKPDSWLRLIVCSIGIGLAFRFASWAWMVTRIAFGFYGPGDPEQAAGPMFWWACPPGSYLVLSIFVMAVLTPVVEEVINRGLILCSLLKKNKTLAIVLSAALFSILHIYEGIPLAFVFGIVAAIQMLNYRTLWGTIIAHSTFNFMITIDWDCLQGIWIPESTSPSLGAVSLVTTGLLIWFAIWLARSNSAGAN